MHAQRMCDLLKEIVNFCREKPWNQSILKVSSSDSANTLIDLNWFKLGQIRYVYYSTLLVFLWIKAYNMDII